MQNALSNHIISKLLNPFVLFQLSLIALFFLFLNLVLFINRKSNRAECDESERQLQ